MPRKKKIDLVEQETPETQETPQQPTVTSPFGFNFLDQADEVTEKVQATVATMAARRKNKPTQFRSFSDVEKAIIPVADLALQYLCDNPGIPQGSLIEIIGAEGTGKTTLAHMIEAQALLNGCPVYHQECENKAMRKNHVARILSSDPAMGKKMLRAIHYDTARSLEESYDKLIDWIRIMRGKETGGRKDSVSIPMHVPLVAVIDPWGKLMSKEEADGVYDYGKGLANKEKSLLELSNMGHSKAAHRWVRRLPHILGDMNVTLILIQHQNSKVDMSGAASPMMAGDAGALYNDTKIGGKAFGQLDSMQVILVRKGLIKDSSGTPVGKTVRARMHKNSYGAESRIIEYDLINDKYTDTEGYLDRVLRFDRFTAEFLAENQALELSIRLRRINCPDLELTGATYSEFYSALSASPDVLKRTAKNLRIQGFSDNLNDIDKKLMEELYKEESQIVV
jgi:RecA/RadA recombinase